MAAPAWKMFNWFDESQVKDSRDFASTPEIFKNTHQITSILPLPTFFSQQLSPTPVSLLLLADDEGLLHLVTPSFEIVRSWTGFPRGSATGLKAAATEGKSKGGKGWEGVIVAVGDDETSEYPVLKVWDLCTFPVAASSPPRLLATGIIKHGKVRHPVSTLAVTPGLSHIAVGLASGSVLLYSNVDSILQPARVLPSEPATKPSLPKAKEIFRSSEPVTGLGFRIDTPSSDERRSRGQGSKSKGAKQRDVLLFIVTIGHVLHYLVAGDPKSIVTTASSGAGVSGSAAGQWPGVTALDDIGAGLGCSAMLNHHHALGSDPLAHGKGEQVMVVARDEAIYVYGKEGRGSCWAYEGPKSSISSFSTYLVIVSPPLAVSASSQSATVRNYARLFNSRTESNGLTDSEISKVSIFDLENKCVAFTGAFGHGEGVREVWNAWGDVFVLANDGKVSRLEEKPLQHKLDSLFQKKLYLLAINLAKSRHCSAAELAEIYHQYGDHLYEKGDYDGAMGQFIKTIGFLQPSYVIRKFLDAQRIVNLTSYLQELHTRKLATADHTTLLLNMYGKLKDHARLDAFIKDKEADAAKARAKGAGDGATTSADELPFDLDTAIRVCRQAGYYDHAIYLAKKYEQHQEYLRIQIEDRQEWVDAVRYIRTLGPEEAQANLYYGKTLLSNLPRETTELLIDLCCGTLDRPMESTEPSTSMTRMGKGGSYLSYLSYGKGGPTTTTTTAQISQPMANATASAALPAPTHERTLTASSVETPDGLDRRKSVVGSSRIMQYSMVSEPDLELPPLRQFFPYFVDHPDYFIRFLETVAARRWNQRLESSDMPPPRQRTSSEGDEDGNLREGQSEDDGDGKDQKAVWNTLLELYLTHGSSKTKTTNTNGFDGTSRPEVSEDKALRLLQSKGRIPYDANQALLVCTTTGFVPGLITLYEQMQMHDEIVRFYIDRAESPEFDQAAEARKVFESLAKYGPSNPSLYPLVLRFLTSSESLLSTHQKDFEEILEVVDRDSLMSPIKVVQLLSRNKVASVGMLKQFLTRRIVAERQEIDADRGLIDSYRTETVKKRKEIKDLADPTAPRIFQVTRCSLCGHPLDLPRVHFMCSHTYHQRCLPENESECPNCARAHGVVAEIRRNNERLADRHDLFLADVRESEDGFGEIASAFGKGLMEFARAKRRADS